MKIVRRILAVLLLIIIVLVIGYLCFTGSRLADMQENSRSEVIYEQTNEV